MIKSFADSRTRAVFEGRHANGIPADILKVARRKLNYLDAATALDALQVPPGNRLHPLFAARAGHHAIWINDQFRLCFRWPETGPEDVEIVDYH